MKELQKKVRKELDNIAEKGITSSNLEATNKLVDIYKDILEICEKEDGGDEMYGARGRYREYDDYDTYNTRGGRGGSYNDHYNHYPLDDRTERYFIRMREGMENYDAGRSRYRDGGSNERMVEGIEMTMGAIVNFVESLMDIAETS
jgi:hypothetical protein